MAEVIKSLRSGERFPAMYKQAALVLAHEEQDHREAASVPADIESAEHFGLNLFLPFIEQVC